MMKIQRSRGRLFFAAMVLVTAAIICIEGESSFASGSRPDTPDDVVVNQSGTKALVIRWKKVKGADGYEIQKARGNLGGYRKAGYVKKTVFKDKKVKPGKSRTYRVRAYKLKRKKKIYGPYSYSVSAKLCRKNDKRRNALRPDLALDIFEEAPPVKELPLAIGESINRKYEELFVTVEGPKRKGHRDNYAPLNSKVRWFSTDPSIVKASSKWKIKAGNKPGSAHIYVRAHNGKKSNKIKVTVKDYAYEPVEIRYAPGRLQVLFNKFEKEIRDICSYYSRNRVSETYEIWSNGDEYTTKGTLSDTTKMPEIKKILEESTFQATEIKIMETRVKIIVGNWPTSEEELVFFYERRPESQKFYEEISPYWFYSKLFYE